MKIKILLLFIIAIISSNFVSADVIFPGERSIDYCSRINNIHEFPDYYFISFDQTGMTSPYIITDNSCITGMKHGATILAIHKNNFNEDLLDFQNLMFYQSNNDLLMEENIRISFLASQWDPRNKIINNLEIISKNNEFTLKSSKQFSYDITRFSFIYGTPLIALIILLFMVYNIKKEEKK
ncbi:MAG: hypothetical protein ACMXX8_01595 [Candidatus Woesearchaeota archaeon]